MLTFEDLHILLPQIIVAGSAILLLLCIAIRRNTIISYLISLAALVVAFVFLINLPNTQQLATNLFIIDPLGKFLSGLILSAGGVIVVFSYPYFSVVKIVKEEYYVLLLLAILGTMCMVISNHFISFVLSLEVLSVSLFGLIGYLKERKVSIESGIKYLIMAAVATSFVLFGFALIYATTGSMDLQGIGAVLRTMPLNAVSLAGLALVIVGFGFKMALTPFHLWTPDIYAAAPAPVSAFVATISKGAAFVFLLRLFYSVGGLLHDGIWIAFAVIATASMFIGNWLALRQQNIKRLLAYSSISHLGYLMVAFLSFSLAGINASVFYLSVYFVSMLAAFGLITYLSFEKGEPLMLEDYRGLFWSRPWLAAFFSVVMLSLAGIPLTAGFMGKFYILAAGINGGALFLLFVLVISSTIGLFYYLKVIAVMLTKSPITVHKTVGDQSWLLKIVMIILFILLFWFGVYPSTFLKMIGAG